MDAERKLLKLKREVSDLKTERDQLGGRLEAHFETLKNLGVKDMKSAKKKQKALGRLLKEKRNRLMKLLDTIEELKNGKRENS